MSCGFGALGLSSTCLFAAAIAAARSPWVQRLYARALYAGAYYIMVIPIGKGAIGDEGPVRPTPFYAIGDVNNLRWYNHIGGGMYQGPHCGLQRFFAPMHWIDRRIRSQFWEQ